MKKVYQCITQINTGDVVKGFYYWSGDQWENILNSSKNIDGLTTGVSTVFLSAEQASDILGNNDRDTNVSANSSIDTSKSGKVIDG